MCGNTGRVRNPGMVRDGRDLKDPPVPPRCHGRGHLPLAQLVPSLIQAGLEASPELWKRGASKSGLSAPSSARGEEKTLPKVAPPAPEILGWTVLSFPRQRGRCWGDARIPALKIPVSPRNSYPAHIRHPGKLRGSCRSARGVSQPSWKKGHGCFLGGGRDGGRKGPPNPSGCPRHVWWLHSQPELPLPIVNNSISFPFGSRQSWPQIPPVHPRWGQIHREGGGRIPRNGSKGASFITGFMKFPVSIRVFPGKWAGLGGEHLIRCRANCRGDSQAKHP